MADQRIGRYQILEEIAAGGQATVYRARDLTLGRIVALKILHPHLARNAQFRERFLREARTAASLTHLNVVVVYEVDEEAGQLYMAMEFLPSSLHDKVRGDGALSVEEAIDITRHVARALQAAHALGIVHRDLKPQNIMLTEDGVPKVTDFGIARAAEFATMTATGAIMGTPQYMSPEQARGERVDDIRSDIYSLGIVLYEMLTGHTPLERNTIQEVMRHHLGHRETPLDALADLDLPSGVGALLERLLAKDATDRYQAPTEVIRALDRAVTVVGPAQPRRDAPSSERWPCAETPRPPRETAPHSPREAPQDRLQAARVAKPLPIPASLIGIPKSLIGQGVGVKGIVVRIILVLWGIVLLWGGGTDISEEEIFAGLLTLVAGFVTLFAATPMLRGREVRLGLLGRRRLNGLFVAGGIVLFIVGIALTSDNQVGPGASPPASETTPRLAPPAPALPDTTDAPALASPAAAVPAPTVAPEVSQPAPPVPVTASAFAVAPAAALGRIAFTSDRDGDYEIYVMNLENFGLTKLTNNPADDRYPSWSLEGTRIAFSSDRDGSDDIYVMKADGSDLIHLTDLPANEREPSWSPDGTRIAFSSERDGRAEIYVVNVDGSGVTRLTSKPALDTRPSWSPDNKRIVFSSNREGNWDIWLMNADGSDQTNLTNNSGDDLQASWSPDGSRIAFSSNRDEGHWEIYVMNTDGSNQTNLTNSSGEDVWPSWSPDGKSIAFSSTGFAADTRGGRRDLYAMKADGSQLTRLTDNPASEVWPSWSSALPTELMLGLQDDPQPVLAEEVFADIFQNATRVDRVSIDDINNCEVVSSFDVKLGDTVSVEVALARKEDGLSGRLAFRPYFTLIRDTSGDGVLGNIAEDYHLRFGLERTINNAWNETNAGPYVVAVYRGKRSVAVEPSNGNVVIGDWVPNWGGLVPGTYTVGFVEDESIYPFCDNMLREIDATNLIEDSVLLAWYVN